MREKNLSLYLLVISIFLGVIHPAMLSEGMFVDGVTYASIARNLADGIGSFWDLHYTETLYPHFREHPPLAIGMQALLFRTFGGSYLVERIYSLLTFFITGGIMVGIWKRFQTKAFRDLGWLPLLIWISFPLITWAAPNNLLENTLMIFVSLAVFSYIRSTRSRFRAGLLLLTGFFLFLGFLTKGFVALFPFTGPFWYFIFISGNFKRFLAETSLIVAGFSVSLVILFLLKAESLTYMREYIDHQVFGSIKNAQTVSSRFSILWILFLQSVPALLTAVLLTLISRGRFLKSGNQPWIRVWVALALSGILPIMISLKQRGFYILATLPFLSLAFSCFLAPVVKQILERKPLRKYRSIRLIHLSVCLLGITVFLNLNQIGHIGRDHDILEDVFAIREVVPAKGVISASETVWHDWSLHAYLQRYSRISLDREMHADGFILLSKEKDTLPDSDPDRSSLALRKYELFFPAP